MFDVKGVAIGKFDKNGIEVCEGDVVRVCFKSKFRLDAFENYTVEWDSEFCGFSPFFETDCACDSLVKDGFEIIGSVYKEGDKCHCCNETLFTELKYHSCKRS